MVAAGDFNAQMFNSFLDGTKSAIEMAAVSNATGLQPSPSGLHFPPCGVDDLARVLRPREDGGILHHRGQVEVVSSLERDGRPVFRDLRWGVYVTLAADSDYVRRCFKEYGLVTDPGGNYTAMYKPHHLLGLELGVSVASVGLRREPTGAPAGWHGDVVATAKRDLPAGQALDGEGGYGVWPADAGARFGRGRLPAAGPVAPGQAQARCAPVAADTLARCGVRRTVHGPALPAGDGADLRVGRASRLNRRRTLRLKQPQPIRRIAQMLFRRSSGGIRIPASMAAKIA